MPRKDTIDVDFKSIPVKPGIRTAIGKPSPQVNTDKQTRSLLARLDEGVQRRFDGAFFTALGVVLMLRTLTYVDTVASVRAGIGVELNPFARLNTSFVAGSDIIFALTVILITIVVSHREIRLVGYSFVVALVSADFAFDMAQFLELPPVNLTISQVYALVWGLTAIIPLAVGVWQIEELRRKGREERPLAGARLENLEPNI